MAKLILIRGLPGSGKSTLARAMLQAGVVQRHYEADMFFEQFRRDEKTGVIYELEDSEEREYIFDGRLIGEAHEWCQRMTREALGRAEDVVVSNTFTRHKEMDWYTSLAYGANGIRVVSDGALVEPEAVYVLTARGNFGSIHNIPEASLARMKQRWED